MVPCTVVSGIRRHPGFFLLGVLFFPSLLSKTHRVVFFRFRSFMRNRVGAAHVSHPFKGRFGSLDGVALTHIAIVSRRPWRARFASRSTPTNMLMKRLTQPRLRIRCEQNAVKLVFKLLPPRTRNPVPATPHSLDKA